MKPPAIAGPLVDRLLYLTARARPTSVPPGDRANIGCANSVAPGWVNLDNSPSAVLARFPALRAALRVLRVIPADMAQGWPTDLVLHDVRRPLPWQDGALRFVYTSHLLEHLFPDDATALLRECHRVLRSGGLIRVVVPDLEIFADRYVKALRASDTEAVRAASEELLDVCGARAHSSISPRNPHRWMYDRYSLSEALSAAGFLDARICPPKVGKVPDLDVLDHRAGHSLHIEARRP